MKILAAFTKHNPKFERYRPEKEDAFRYKTNGKIIIAVVADGITRDPIGIKTRPEFSDKKAMKETASNYPRPSPAKIAANLFCESFVEYSDHIKIN